MAIQQLTKEHLKTMSPDQINAAREAGQCETLLGRPLPVEYGDKQLTKGELNELYAAKRYDEIVRLQAAGQFNHLLGIK